MPADNILVIAVDGLRASALGAYGNTFYSTPALDELAAHSFLLDACFADASELPPIYRALWQSAHPLRVESTDDANGSLPGLLAARGYATTLVTDDLVVASLGASKEFHECVRLPASEPARAENVSRTATARFFAALCDQLQPARAPRLIWAHARGLYGPWDAPLELQELLLEREEGDPAPRTDVEPPDFALDDASDPDAAFAISCAYAAQVMVLDACWEGLRQLLDDIGALDRWLVVLLGARGFPLGEHGHVGGVDDRLFAEQLHVPMLWRFPDGSGRLARSGQLVSHLDLLPTLLEWIDGRTGPSSRPHGNSLLPLTNSDAAPLRETLIAIGSSGQRAVRTADWCLHCSQNLDRGERQPQTGRPGEHFPQHELYVRPDDRWEANDVASLCPDVVQELSHRLER